MSSINRKYTTYHNATRRTEPRPQEICILHKKARENRSSSSRDMLMDRQTDTQTDWPQYPAPTLPERSNESMNDRCVNNNIDQLIINTINENSDKVGTHFHKTYFAWLFEWIVRDAKVVSWHWVLHQSLSVRCSSQLHKQAQKITFCD